MTTVDYYRSPATYHPFSTSPPSSSTTTTTTTTSSTPFPTDDLQNCFWGPLIDTNIPASITFTSPTSNLPAQLPLLSTSCASISAPSAQAPSTPFSAAASPVLSAAGSRKRRRKTTTDLEEPHHHQWITATSTPIDHDSPPLSSTGPPSPGARSSSGGGPGSGGASSSFRNVSACNRCRLRKNRCDQRLPACSSCEKADVKCVGYDPLNKREVPRSYVFFLEQRLQYLETLLSSHHIPYISAEDFPDLPLPGAGSVPNHHHNLPSPSSVSTPMSMTATLPPSPPPQMMGQLTPPHPGMQQQQQQHQMAGRMNSMGGHMGQEPQCAGPCCWATPAGVQVVMRDFGPGSGHLMH